MNEGKTVLSVEMDTVVADYIRKVAAQIGKPIDETLMLYAVLGIQHHAECKKNVSMVLP